MILDFYSHKSRLTLLQFFMLDDVNGTATMDGEETEDEDEEEEVVVPTEETQIP